MQIENSTIIFKSYPENYNPESSGMKQNTLRIIPKDEMPFFKIINGILFVNNTQITHVKIINTRTEESFTKALTWVTQFNNEFLFSWNDTFNAAKIPAFSHCQQIKLEANNHKTPLNLIPLEYMMSRLLDETSELFNELFTPECNPRPIVNNIKICDEAIDVANFALFIFSKFAISPEEYQQFINSKYEEIRNKKE